MEERLKHLYKYCLMANHAHKTIIYCRSDEKQTYYGGHIEALDSDLTFDATYIIGSQEAKERGYEFEGMNVERERIKLEQSQFPKY